MKQTTREKQPRKQSREYAPPLREVEVNFAHAAAYIAHPDTPDDLGRVLCPGGLATEGPPVLCY
jgi:hypothetical protein